jgi:adenylate cyclase
MNLKVIVPLLFAIVLGAASAGYVFLEENDSWDRAPLLALDRKLLDFKFLRRGRIKVNPQVVIAAGDERTIASFGRWGTWDRARFAKILDNLFAAGADVAAFDIVFADPVGLDYDSTASIAKLLGDAQLSAAAGQLAIGASEGHAPSPSDIAQVAMAAKQIEDAYAGFTKGDAVFASSLDKHTTRVVQGFIAEPDQEEGGAPPDYSKGIAALENFAIKGYGFGYKYTELDDKAKAAGAETKVATVDLKPGSKASELDGVIAVKGDLVLPEKAFLDVATNVGFFSAHPDPDGVLRRLPLVYRLGDNFIPSLSLSAAAAHFGGNPGLIADSFTKRGLIRIGLPKDDGTIVDVETDLNGRLLVNYYGPSEPNDPSLPDDKRGAFPRVSLVDIYENHFDPSIVKGKVVLIAVTAIGTFDQRVTPFSPDVPGTEVHAAALQNIIDGVELRRPLLFVEIEMALAFVVALLFGLALPRVNIAAGTVLFLATLAAWWVVDIFVLFPKNMWFYDAPITLQMLLTFGGITVFGYLTEGREKAQLKKEFSTVLAPTVVEQLLKDPSLAGLGGMERELTVMFSDIRGFTSMSEKLTPEGLTRFLNEYLTPMTEILIQREGTLDKYMGDAIMAFWGAPIEQKDHAARAALAAIDMLETLDVLKSKWRSEGKPDIDIGIGLNSGLMRVGFMGSERMRNYTLLGDNVNLGSRLEGTNKNYGTHIIVSETTFEQAKHMVYGRWLDAVRVKGKHQPVNIYELLGKRSSPGAKAPAEMQKLIDVFEAGLKSYRAKKWADAELAFLECIKMRGGKDAASSVYLERVAHFKEEPPPENWDGVYEFKTK